MAAVAASSKAGADGDKQGAAHSAGGPGSKVRGASRRAGQSAGKPNAPATKAAPSPSGNPGAGHQNPPHPAATNAAHANGKPGAGQQGPAPRADNSVAKKQDATPETDTPGTRRQDTAHQPPNSVASRPDPAPRSDNPGTKKQDTTQGPTPETNTPGARQHDTAHQPDNSANAAQDTAPQPLNPGGGQPVAVHHPDDSGSAPQDTDPQPDATGDGRPPTARPAEEPGDHHPAHPAPPVRLGSAGERACQAAREAACRQHPAQARRQAGRETPGHPARPARRTPHRLPPRPCPSPPRRSRPPLSRVRCTGSAALACPSGAETARTSPTPRPRAPRRHPAQARSPLTSWRPLPRLGRLTPAEAFDALYCATAPALARQAYLLTGRTRLSRESVERAFHLAWENWPEVATDRDPAGWVRAAAYEYAMAPWHRFRRARKHPDQPPAEPERRALLDALLELPPAYRRTVLLYDGLGLDLPETAAETEASTPAAAYRLLHARAAIARRVPEVAGAKTRRSSPPYCATASPTSRSPEPLAVTKLPSAPVVRIGRRAAPPVLDPGRDRLHHADRGRDGVHRVTVPHHHVRPVPLRASASAAFPCSVARSG